MEGTKTIKEKAPFPSGPNVLAIMMPTPKVRTVVARCVQKVIKILLINFNFHSVLFADYDCAVSVFAWVNKSVSEPAPEFALPGISPGHMVISPVLL